MSTGRPPPGSIPTLTEVVTWPGATPPPAAPAVQAVPPAPAAPPAAVAVAPVPAPAPVAAPAPAPVAPPVAVATPPLAPAPAPVAAPTPIDEAQLQQRVLANIQKQVDLMLEVRLREALAPALGRATDALVRDARKELTSTLRDIVAQSVARELARRDER